MESFIIQFFGIMESIKNALMGITHEDIGFLSTICLGLCSLPLFLKTIKEGHCKGVSGYFVLFLFLGYILGTAYVIPLAKIPLIINFVINSIIATTILIYKIRKG